MAFRLEARFHMADCKEAQTEWLEKHVRYVHMHALNLKRRGKWEKRDCDHIRSAFSLPTPFSLSLSLWYVYVPSGKLKKKKNVDYKIFWTKIY